MPNPTTPEIITARGRDSLIDFAERQFTSALADTYNAAIDFPGFLASGDPPPPNLILPKALSRQACRRWARGGTPVIGPGFDAAWGGICNPYLNSIGESPSNGFVKPDFVGGQCSGVTYEIWGEVWQPFSGVWAASDRIGGSLQVIKGPITSLSVSQAALCSAGGFDGRQSSVVATSSFPSEPTLTIPRGCVANGPGGVPGIRNLRPVRSDGLPDNCGSLPPKYLPPQTPTGLPPLNPTTVTLPGIGDVAVDVSFDEDGNVLISLPDLGIDLEVPNPFGPGGDPGDPGSAPPPPGDQGTPGTPVDVDGEPAEGEDDDRYLVGVLVQTIEIPSRANARFNDSGAYYSGLYYVYLGGSEGLEQQNAAIVKPTQFFYAPEASNRFRVEPNNNVAVRVTPFWRDNV